MQYKYKDNTSDIIVDNLTGNNIIEGKSIDYDYQNFFQGVVINASNCSFIYQDYKETSYSGKKYIELNHYYNVNYSGSTSSLSLLYFNILGTYSNTSTTCEISYIGFIDIGGLYPGTGKHSKQQQLLATTSPTNLSPASLNSISNYSSLMTESSFGSTVSYYLTNGGGTFATASGVLNLKLTGYID